MSSQSLSDLQQQAQITYVYWPLWLLLKQKRIQQLLADTGTTSEPAIQRLTIFKLPLPDNIPDKPLPQLQINDTDTLSFEVNINEDIASFLVKRDDTHNLRLLQMSHSDRWYLDHACTQFQEMATHHSTHEVAQSVLRWVLCHRDLPATFNWRSDSSSSPPESTVGGWE